MAKHEVKQEKPRETTSKAHPKKPKSPRARTGARVPKSPDVGPKEPHPQNPGGAASGAYEQPVDQAEKPKVSPVKEEPTTAAEESRGVEGGPAALGVLRGFFGEGVWTTPQAES